MLNLRMLRAMPPYFELNRRFYRHFKHGVLLFAKKFHGDMKQLTRFFQLIEQDTLFNEALDKGLYQIHFHVTSKESPNLPAPSMETLEEGIAVTGFVRDFEANGLHALWRVFVDILVAGGIVWPELAPNGTLAVVTQNGRIRTSDKPRDTVTDDLVFVVTASRWLPRDQAPRIVVRHFSRGWVIIYHHNENMIETVIDTDLAPTSDEYKDVKLLITEQVLDFQDVVADEESSLDRIQEQMLFFPSAAVGLWAPEEYEWLAGLNLESASYRVYDTGLKVTTAESGSTSVKIAEMRVQHGQDQDRWMHFAVVPGPQGDRLLIEYTWDWKENARSAKQTPRYVAVPDNTPERQKLFDRILREINTVPSTALDGKTALLFFGADFLAGLLPGVQLIGPVDSSDSRSRIFEAIESDYLVADSLRVAMEDHGLTFATDEYQFVPISIGHSLVYVPEQKAIFKLFGGYGTNMGREDFADAVYHEIWHNRFFSFSQTFRKAVYDRFHTKPYFIRQLSYLEIDSVHGSKKEYEERFATEAMSTWSELFRTAMRQSPDNPTPFRLRKMIQERATLEIFARAAESLRSGKLSKEQYDDMTKKIAAWNNLETDDRVSDAMYELIRQADPERILNAPYDGPELEYHIQPGEILLFEKALPPFIKTTLNKHGYTSHEAVWKNDAHAKKVWDELRRGLDERLRDYREFDEDDSRSPE